MTDTENPPAQPPANQARPGPHPHEMDEEELRVAAGDDPSLPEGYEAPDYQSEPVLPDDPHTAAPGPHPHEASDHRRLRGDLKDLPEGVEPYQADTEPDTEPEQAPAEQ